MKAWLTVLLVAAYAAVGSAALSKYPPPRQPNLLFSEPPSISTCLTERGANYLSSVLLPFVTSKIVGNQLPAMSGEKDGFDYSLWSITMNTLKYSSSSVTFQNASSGLTATLNLNGLTADITAQWSFKLDSWPHEPSGSGSVDGSVSNSNIAVGISLDASSTGTPTLVVDTVNVNIGSLDISVSGSDWDWLIDLLKSIFSGTIKDEVTTLLQTEMKALLEKYANQALASVPLNTTFDGFTLNYAFDGNPIYFNSSAIVGLLGAVELASHPVVPPIKHASLPAITPSTMASVMIDQYIFNSAMYTMYTNDYLTYVLSNRNLPPVGPFNLNTSVFCPDIPPLCTEYPKKALAFVFNATSMPTVNITSQGTSFYLDMDVTWVVLDSDGHGNNATAFVLSFQMVFDMDLTMKGTKVVGDLSLVSAPVVLSKTNIGTFDPTPISKFLQAILAGPLIGEVNKALSSGFAIPVIDGLSFSNAELMQREGYIYVYTDLSWSPNFA